jgi:hypothetical protein
MLALKALVAVAGVVAVGTLSATTQSYSLEIGERVDAEEIGLSITFIGVPRDSRCPRDVQCIVAGEAHVVFDVERGAESAELTFKVPPGGSDERELDGVTITLVTLEPETNSTEKIEAADYVATVAVTADP